MEQIDSSDLLLQYIDRFGAERNRGAIVVAIPPLPETLLEEQYAERRVVLPDVEWHVFEFLLANLGDRRTARIAYDGNALEIMTPLLPHESSKCSLDRLVAVLAEELELNLRSTGSLTCKRADRKRGAEPDLSYYIQNEPLVRNKTQVHFPGDPPPDLVVEIEYSQSAADKLEIYRAIAVPELWRYNGKQLQVFCLESDGYVLKENSPTFAPIPTSALPRFLEKSAAIGELQTVREFRAWVRQQLAQT